MTARTAIPSWNRRIMEWNEARNQRMPSVLGASRRLHTAVGPGPPGNTSLSGQPLISNLLPWEFPPLPERADRIMEWAGAVEGGAENGWGAGWAETEPELESEVDLADAINSKDEHRKGEVEDENVGDKDGKAGEEATRDDEEEDPVVSSSEGHHPEGSQSDDGNPGLTEGTSRQTETESLETPVSFDDEDDDDDLLFRPPPGFQPELVWINVPEGYTSDSSAPPVTPPDQTYGSSIASSPPSIARSSGNNAHRHETLTVAFDPAENPALADGLVDTHGFNLMSDLNVMAAVDPSVMIESGPSVTQDENPFVGRAAESANEEEMVPIVDNPAEPTSEESNDLKAVDEFNMYTLAHELMPMEVFAAAKPANEANRDLDPTQDSNMDTLPTEGIPLEASAKPANEVNHDLDTLYDFNMYTLPTELIPMEDDHNAGGPEGISTMPLDHGASGDPNNLQGLESALNAHQVNDAYQTDESHPIQMNGVCPSHAKAPDNINAVILKHRRDSSAGAPYLKKPKILVTAPSPRAPFDAPHPGFRLSLSIPPPSAGAAGYPLPQLAHSPPAACNSPPPPLADAPAVSPPPPFQSPPGFAPDRADPPTYWVSTLSAMINGWLAREGVEASQTSLLGLSLSVIRPVVDPAATVADPFASVVTVGTNAQAVKLVRLRLQAVAQGPLAPPQVLEWVVLEIRWAGAAAAAELPYTVLAFPRQSITGAGSQRRHAGEAVCTTLMLGRGGRVPAMHGRDVDVWFAEEFVGACARGRGVVELWSTTGLGLVH